MTASPAAGHCFPQLQNRPHLPEPAENYRWEEETNEREGKREEKDEKKKECKRRDEE